MCKYYYEDGLQSVSSLVRTSGHSEISTLLLIEVMKNCAKQENKKMKPLLSVANFLTG